jgi:hypothetical protein
MNDLKDLLTISEGAAILKTSRQNIFDAIKRGRLPVMKS